MVLTGARRTRGREAPRAFRALALAVLAVLAAAAPARSAAQAAALVAEAQGTRLLVLDDRLAIRGRIGLDAPVAGLAAFPPAEGRAFAALRDGRVLALDLERVAVVGEARAGAGASGLAASSDGRFLAVATENPAALVVLDAALRRVREIPARDPEGRRASPVTAVRVDARRRSFLAALPGLPELWEVSYDEAAPPIYPGLVHDFRMGEGLALPGMLNPRRAPLDEPAEDFLVDSPGAQVVATAAGAARPQVVNLHVRRRVARLEASDPVPAGTAASWVAAGRTVVAMPLPSAGAVQLLDATTWREVARVPVGGRPAFVRATPGLDTAWVAVSGEATQGDRVVVIDRARAAVVAELRPAAGARVVELAFARGGRHVLALLAGPAGALVRYDARSLEEVARVSLEAPVAVLVP